MARRDEDDSGEYRRPPARSGVTGTHVVLAGVAAGLVAAIVGGGIWWAAREPKPSVDPKRHQEMQDFLRATSEKYGK